jgi:hypothetical protein
MSAQVLMSTDPAASPNHSPTVLFESEDEATSPTYLTPPSSVGSPPGLHPMSEIPLSPPLPNPHRHLEIQREPAQPLRILKVSLNNNSCAELLLK